MITPSRAVRVFGYPAPCDMRKGYDSLGALVRDSLEQDLLDGDMFLFVARNRKRAKVLFFDGTGLFLLCVRLEKGTFACLWSVPGAAEVALTTTELALFLEGSHAVGKKALSPSVLERKDLAMEINI